MGREDTVMTPPERFVIAAAQMRPVNGDPEANLEQMCSLASEAGEKGTLILLFPELALTGYYVKEPVLRKLAVLPDGEWSSPLREAAARYGMLIAAGYPELDPSDGKIYNSCLLIGHSGETAGNVRKRYLWGREKRIFGAGRETRVYSTKAGKIAVLLCYDEEYPEPARTAALLGADILLCPAAWSRRGESRWHIESAANALFNLVYFAGSNFTDENCCGCSMVIGPDGLVLSSAGRDDTGLVMAEFDRGTLNRVREAIPYRRDFLPETLSEALKAGQAGFAGQEGSAGHAGSAGQET